MKTKNKPLTIEDVKHVAKLANLDLSKDDLSKFQRQLLEIVEFVGKVSEVKTENVEPTSQVTGLENILREDKVTPSLSQEEVLANAPRKYKGHFVVKAIF